MRFKASRLKHHSGSAVGDQRGQEWKQMGPYLSLLVLWWSPGLILLSRELLEAREGICLRSPNLGCLS